MKLSLSVSSGKEFAQGGELIRDPVFAIMQWGENQLMLQTGDDLARELPDAGFTGMPVASGTVYFRDFPLSSIEAGLAPGDILKGPEANWYGMREIYLRDPDGYVICLGEPDGDFPG